MFGVGKDDFGLKGQNVYVSLKHARSEKYYRSAIVFGFRIESPIHSKQLN